MIIKSMNLKNFRSTPERDFQYRKGFNLIIGENGSGKSTVMHGLSYMALNYVIGKIDDYIRTGTNSFDVSLELLHNKDEFKIDISRVRGKSSNKQLLLNGELYKNSDASKKLLEYFDPSFCKASFLAFQGEEDLIDSTPAARRENLKKIYDLKFKEQLDKLEEELKFLKDDKLKESDTSITTFEAKTYDHIEPLPLPFEEAVAKEKKVDMQILELKYLELKKANEDHKTNVTNCNLAKTAVEALKKSVEDTDGEILTKNKSLKNTNTDLANLASKHAADKKVLEEELSTIEITRVKKVDSTTLIALKELKQTISFSILEDSKRLELINKGECPTCGHAFETTDSADIKKSLEASKVALEAVKTSILEIETAVAKFDEAIKAMDILKQRKEQLQTKITNIESIEKTERTGLANQILLIEESISDKQTIVTKTRDDLIIKEAKLIELEILVDIDAEYPTKEEAQLKTLSEELENYEKVIFTNESNIEHNERLIEQEVKDTITLRVLRQDRDKIYTSIELHKLGIQTLKKEFPNHVISSMLASIEKGMNEFLVNTYEGRFKVAIEESSSGVDFLFGEGRLPVSSASGAEQQIMNIGLKVAFSKLSGMKVLFLDEVDSQMSEDISKEVFTALNDMITDNSFDQIFVITHNESTKEIIENNFNAKVFEITRGSVA